MTLFSSLSLSFYAPLSTVFGNLTLVRLGCCQDMNCMKPMGEVKGRLLLLFIRDVGIGFEIFIQSNRGEGSKGIMCDA